MTTREIVIAYIRAVEAHDLDEVARWMHPAIEVTEHPNKLSPQGKRYDKPALREAGERGKALLTKERYAIRQIIVEGERAALTIAWEGTLHDGRSMTGEICSVVELRDGLVWRQEQYDCFR